MEPSKSKNKNLRESLKFNKPVPVHVLTIPKSGYPPAIWAELQSMKSMKRSRILNRLYVYSQIQL
jgi:hypothetical protein